MRRKATKQSRGPNAEERRFMAYTKECDCIVCGNSPVIVDHCRGSTFKIKHELVSVLLGHWFVLPLCQTCDDAHTKHSVKVFEAKHGRQIDLWIGHYVGSGITAPYDVESALLTLEG